MTQTLAQPLTHSQVIADFVAGLGHDDVPADLREKARLHLVDTLGVALAAARAEFAGRIVRWAAKGAGRDSSSIIGFSTRVPPQEAAFANGCLARALDADDIHPAALAHPSSIVLPAVLAMAEDDHLDGRSVLTALAVGLEVNARLGLAASATMARNGIPVHVIFGGLAATAAAGRLLGLDGRQIANALGLAGSFAIGSNEGREDGDFGLTAGWAARGAVVAIQLGRQGRTGPLEVLEGQKGLFNALAGPGLYDLALSSGELGSRWEARGVAFGGVEDSGGRPGAAGVAEKFLANAGPTLGEDRARRALDAFMAIEDAPDVARLMAALRN